MGFRLYIFEQEDYRKYLHARLGSKRSRSGLRKKLALSIKVHTTFISQIMAGRSHLSLEQAEACNSFFEHSEEESEFFILLVLRDRAGTKKLRERFQKSITLILKSRLNIKSRIRKSDALDREDREKFYSSYIYGAVHVLTSIPEFQTIESIAKATSLSIPRTKQIVSFLLRIGLIADRDSKFISTSQHVHLENDSELVLKHHINWRTQIINRLNFRDEDDLHYSACVSLSKSDAQQIREILLSQLKKNVEIISNSKEETAYILAIDFCKLFEEI